MPDNLYDQAVRDYVTSARMQTVAGVDANPDEAARNVQLESATGVPSPVIAMDPDQFEQRHKQALASQLVANNPQLTAYVHSHPMAASVSNDDWGNLDMFSRGAVASSAALRRLNTPWERAFNAGVTGAEEGFQEGFGQLPTFQPGPTAVGNLLRSAGLLGQIGVQILSGFGGAVTKGAGAAAEAGAAALGLPNPEKLGRDVSGEAERRMITGEVAPETPGGHWIEAGREVPRGVNPVFDSAKAQINAQMLEHLDEDLTNAQASATKERSPEMFQRFAEQHYGNATIGIQSDAALALYGDKLPAPDDGLLGWVPGIADKLDMAKHTGADVDVPIADWISKVDPAVAKQLHDDMRIWPGGITAREGVDLPSAPRMVDGALAQLRGAAGLEPMFSMGDRKLTLMKEGEATIPALYDEGKLVEDNVHLFQIQDENGQPVGELHLIPKGKDLEVSWIGGNNIGQWANAFGPSLMRDLLRQLKALYPEAETLSGFRVSGARGRMGETGVASVKLDTPEGWGTAGGGAAEDFEKARRLFIDAYRPVNSGIEANVLPTSYFTAHEKQLAAAVHEEVGKLTAGRAQVKPTAGINYGQARGVFFPRSSLILYDLLDKDPVGVGRHEAIHFLRDQGLFSDSEWHTLEEAAKDEGWLQRYDIDRKWGSLNLTPEKKLEEAIAEGFREWASAAEGARREYSPVAQIFQKLMKFLDGLKDRFKEIFGHVPTADELFQKVSSGEIGQRATQGSAGGGPMFSAEDLDNLKAESVGLDLKSFQRIQKMVQERYKADVEASARTAEKEQARRQTKEWKDNKAQMATEVEATIRQRPDIATDLFLGSGELYGEKLRQRFTLAAGDLTAEQKAALPAHYVSKNGLPVDEVARMFGYPSGDAMVDHLAAYKASTEGLSPNEALRKVVDTETDRQMEAKYGNLGQNILTEAQDQALSENSLNLLTEEYHAAALQAGVAVVDKATIQAKAADIVSKMPLAEAKSAKFLQETGKSYRNAVRSLVAGDAAGALVHLEKRTLNGFIAAELTKLEKEQAKLAPTLKYYSKPWDPTKDQRVEPDFSIFTRQLLANVGLRNGMSVPGIAKAISESRFTSLQDFVTKTENEDFISGLELPVADWMMQAGKSADKFTVDEWRQFRDAVTTLDKVGRADQKVIQAGVAKARADWIASATSQLKDKFDPIPLEKTRSEGLHHSLTTIAAALTSNETLMSRFDGRDPHGIFTETITKPGAEAANRKARLQRETAAAYKELGEIKDADKALTSPFLDPETGKPVQMTRRELNVVISNMGNAYNWSVLAKGWRADPDVLWKWVEANSTPEDLERAQKLGDIFKGLKAQADMEYQHLYGIAPENVIPRPFEMHGKQWDGWYHPIIGDPILSRYVNKMPDTEVERNFWPSTSNAYMKRRTGAVQVVDLTYNSIPAKLDQIIHDISMRAFVSNTARIFKDTQFRQTISRYYGLEYMQSMDSWLKRVAGDSSYNTGALKMASKWSNTFRQNVISTAIAFNPGTVEKHGLTAFAMSAHELNPNLLKSLPQFSWTTLQVAPSLFKRAALDLFGKSSELGDSLFDFIKKNSEEIQRRDRNWRETIGGQQNVFEGRGTWREQISQAGAKFVAFSDMLSAAPLWLAKYRAELEANGGDIGSAIQEADMGVRRAHGSTAITNLPSIAAGKDPFSPWLTSLYGFMGTSMQRRIEIMHDINDAYKLGMHGDIVGATKMVPKILASTAVNFLWVGLVEELIAGQFTDDRRGLGSKALTFSAGMIAQSIVGLRDLSYDLTHGQESVGLISTPIHHLQQFLRDADKANPLGRAHAGKLVQDFCSTLGDLSGACPTHMGSIMRYGIDSFNGFQHPRSVGDVYRGLSTGSQKIRIQRK